MTNKQTHHLSIKGETYFFVELKSGVDGGVVTSHQMIIYINKWHNKHNSVLRDSEHSSDDQNIKKCETFSSSIAMTTMFVLFFFFFLVWREVILWYIRSDILQRGKRALHGAAWSVTFAGVSLRRGNEGFTWIYIDMKKDETGQIRSCVVVTYSILWGENRFAVVPLLHFKVY